ncbi:MAG: ABC transporter substrate-binding protein [Thermomicrobiales bacterium]
MTVQRSTFRRASLASLLAAVMIAGGLAPSSPGAEALALKTGTLQVRISTWPGTMDPTTTFWAEDAEPSLLDFEGLTRIGADLTAQPAAAERWTVSDDGLTVTFTLRAGLTYSDGSPLTAQRFAYAF